VINPASLKLIKEFEGFRPKPYRCPAGVLTIGYGHTGPDVKPGMLLTEKRGEELLVADIKEAEAYIKAKVFAKLNDNQYGALVSLVFNVGSLGDGILVALNTQNFTKATETWLRYCNVNGKPNDGLKRRREAEVALFNTTVKKDKT
jgi:lysozyme